MQKIAFGLAGLVLLSSQASAFTKILICQPGKNEFDNTVWDTGLTTVHTVTVSSTVSPSVHFVVPGTDYIRHDAVVDGFSSNNPIYDIDRAVVHVAANEFHDGWIFMVPPIVMPKGVTFHVVAHGPCNPKNNDVMRFNVF
jgi:hypothetical protein